MDGGFGDAIAFHAPVPGGREHVYVLTGMAGAATHEPVPFNRPLRTGGESARIAEALERAAGPAATARRASTARRSSGS